MNGSSEGPRSLRVTIVAANAFRFDSRLRRTALALAGDGHRVTIVAFRDEGLPEREALAEGVEVVRVDLDRSIAAGLRPLPRSLARAVLRLLGIDEAAAVLPVEAGSRRARWLAVPRRGLEIVANLRRSGPWRDAVLRVAGDADVFHCKALIALPVVRGAAHRRGTAFAYDLADLHSEAARLARMPGFVRRLIRAQERRLLAGVAVTFAVSEAVADEATRWFGIARPTVLRNTPLRWLPDLELPPPSRRLAEAAGFGPDTRVVLYQGGLSVDRGIEELVAALDAEPLRGRDVGLAFLGYGRLEAWLRSVAMQQPMRVALVPPVPPSELLAWTSSADVSFLGFPPRTVNLRLALSNKLFESMMAGVPVITAAGTEHARVVAADDLGVVTSIDDPGELAAAIVRLLDEDEPARFERRRRARSLALSRDNWEMESRALVAAYRAIPLARTSSPRAVDGVDRSIGAESR